MPKHDTKPLVVTRNGKDELTPAGINHFSPAQRKKLPHAKLIEMAREVEKPHRKNDFLPRSVYDPKSALEEAQRMFDAKEITVEQFETLVTLATPLQVLAPTEPEPVTPSLFGDAYDVQPRNTQLS